MASPRSWTSLNSLRRPHRVTRLRRALPILLLALAATLVAAAPASADVRYRFLQFNMCGGKCNGGDTGEPVRAIVRTILDHRPQAVSLNEVCRPQYRILLASLAEAGYRMGGRFATTKPGEDRCDGKDFGNVILSRRRVERAFVMALPNPRGARERRKMACVVADMAVPTILCSTHLAPRPDRVLERQLAALAEIGFQMAAEAPTVLMGDLNVTPDALRGSGLTRRYRDVDHADNESTLGGGKIDYILVSRRWWRDPSGDATRSHVSDHDPLRGAATLDTNR
jgi:endonuclease/exonuclease/phosphatase family metal-dependent hydrolase